MIDIREKLRRAAIKGSEVEVKALLSEPGCTALIEDEGGMTALMWGAFYGKDGSVQLLLPASDALHKSKSGMTALMWAAFNGNQACCLLLLPKSDALAEDEAGRAASWWAKKGSHVSLAQFIDDYALAQSDKANIDSATGPGTTCGRTAPRV